MKEIIFVESLILCLLQTLMIYLFLLQEDLIWIREYVISKNNVYYYKMQVGTDNKIRVNGFYATPKNELVGSQHFGNHRQIFENVGKDTIEYDAHMRMKINFMMYKVYRDLEQSDFLILQNMCELRRTQIQMINALSYENNRLAGYMLTGNRSMFLEIEGVIGFLYCVQRKFHRWKYLIAVTTVFRSFMTEKLCLLILLRAKHFHLQMK